MDQSERYKIALHEAGHAIMAHACGFSGVCIDLGGDDGRGRTVFDDGAPASDDYHARRALIALAGVLTERMATGEDPPSAHMSKDLSEATSHIAALPGQSLESFVEKVSEYMGQELPLGLIEEVAMAAIMSDGLPSAEFEKYADRIAPFDLGQ